MPSLAAAHRGYEYQDLLVASRLVDMLLGIVESVHVDEKLVDDDRFDDLSTVDIAGKRERSQFKHTDESARHLSLATFTTDRRDLRLDRVLASVLADRSGPGQHATTFSYRIVLRDGPPEDRKLTAVLKPVAVDPGPFLPGFGTRRFRFDPVSLWNQRNGATTDETERPFSFLFAGDSSLTLSDVEWACEHLVIEVDAPPASRDLTAPGAAERLLLNRVRAEVGAEVFPNGERSVVDVAAAIISTARAARQGLLVVTGEELLRRAQLRSDFGAVAHAHPVDRALEVLRPSTVRQILEAAADVSQVGGHLVVTGPPGQGKSWVCQQVLGALSGDGWLTAEHYCYLGDADGERNERVLSESVFGSLVGRLAETDPSLVAGQRPRFAADEDVLEGYLQRSLAKAPNRRIALLIDGIDHITRVRARAGDRFDPSRSLAEAIAALALPAGAVAIVLSQPGSHLEPFEALGASVSVPGLSRDELTLLAQRLNVLPSSEQTSSVERPVLVEADRVEPFLRALEDRSSGNALYATYLCRETLRHADTVVDPAATVRSLPQFDGTLKNYYQHLYTALGAEAGWVADVIALVPFAVTRAELRQIRPDAAHRVDAAVSLLAPVLVERATQGGVRVYHESFARYLRGVFDRDTSALMALLERIASWLEGKGLFADPRSFRSLLPILSEAGNDHHVVDLVDRTFVTRAVAAGFHSSAIVTNLAAAVGAAARLGEWTVIVRCVELARAADSYQSERLDSTLVAFADVPARILGADTLAARLLDDDRLVMPAREGLQMCAAVDRLGATAPWRAYMSGYLREAQTDKTSYGAESDRAVELAWMRGRLRLAATPTAGAESPLSGEVGQEQPADEQSQLTSGRDLASPIRWNRLAASVEEDDLSMREIVAAVVETHGDSGIYQLIQHLKRPAEACLVVAERLTDEQAAVGGDDVSPRQWAIAAVAHGVPAGSVHRALRLGIDATLVSGEPVEPAREQLLRLTRRMQERSVLFEDGDLKTWQAWLDACSLAARLDAPAIRSAEIVIVGEGWYRCWLRFVLALSIAEVAQRNQGALAVEALRLLTEDLRPFAGDPRACDLYPLQGAIEDTLTRAILLLDDAQWAEGLEILERVSDSINTTFRGEMGGPVPPDFLLRLAVHTATPTRHRAAEALVEGEIATGSARRYYSDLAEYRLIAARLALAANKPERANVLWQEACVLLTAYGLHKDITIYEVLNPLPSLIRADPARARQRVAAIQGLCERVPWHTDRKETRGAWSRWWQLLAKADPGAVVRLAVPALLKRCNDPNTLLDGALDDVWEEWHERVDPLLSGALRLTLDKPLDQRDGTQIQRLADDSSTKPEVRRRLMTWLLARADERPVAYSYSNSAELLAKDDGVVASLNTVALSADIPVVSSVPRGPSSSLPSEPSSVASSVERSSDTIVDAASHLSLPPGLPGLTRAIRAWRRRPYDTRLAMWVPERLLNAIGYRLIELAVAGRHQEAVSALRSLGDSIDFGDRSGILRSVAEGLERHGQNRLAAVAYTLAWTRARGHDGWLTFGGETELESLERASSLDPLMAGVVVAEEIERAVAASYGPYGISQAIAFAFAAGALRAGDQRAVDTAFAVWDEACAVIGARAPRVSASDDPGSPYVPPSPDAGEVVPGDLGPVFALAVLGGLFHPSRERRRRTLLAAQLLLEQRPDTAAEAFSTALSTISDPATLTWLLWLVGSSREEGVSVVVASQSILRELTSRKWLTARALARRLVNGDEPPLVHSAVPESALVAGGTMAIWTPTSDSEEASDESNEDVFLEVVAGKRLEGGERVLPGLTRAVHERVTSSLKNGPVERRLRSQLDELGDSLRKRWPDAFLAREETVEGIVQSVAAGGRAAMLATGNLVADGAAWEDKLASALVDSPEIPLILEATRQARPSIPPPSGNGDAIWGRIRSRAGGTSKADSDIEEAMDEEGILVATLRVERCSSAETVERGTFRGWRWLGTMEQRWIEPDWRAEKDLYAKRYRVVEVRDVGDRQALLLPPVASSDLRMWKASIDPAPAASVLTHVQPLIGVDHELKFVADGRMGLGAPNAVLVPTAALIASLDLKPGEGCTYHDCVGAGLALVTWRAEYDRSEYYLPRPRISGTGIAIRPDLFDRLTEGAGDQRLVMRDFMVGVADLAPKPS